MNFLDEFDVVELFPYIYSCTCCISWPLTFRAKIVQNLSTYTQTQVHMFSDKSLALI